MVCFKPVFFYLGLYFNWDALSNHWRGFSEQGLDLNPTIVYTGMQVGVFAMG
jgi:hypothetical protein